MSDNSDSAGYGGSPEKKFEESAWRTERGRSFIYVRRCEEQKGFYYEIKVSVEQRYSWENLFEDLFEKVIFLMKKDETLNALVSNADNEKLEIFKVLMNFHKKIKESYNRLDSDQDIEKLRGVEHYCLEKITLYKTNLFSRGRESIFARKILESKDIKFWMVAFQIVKYLIFFIENGNYEERPEPFIFRLTPPVSR